MRSWLIMILTGGLGVACGGAATGEASRPASVFPPSVGAPADVAAARGLCPMATLTAGEQRLRVTLEGDVLFDTAKSDLKPAAIGVLEKVKKTVIDAHPDARLEVEGHTDDRASDEYNRGLSERRAASVAGWLEQKGIVASRITRRGYGEKFPRVSNDSDANRAKNRRVEIVVQWGPGPAARTPQACQGAQACCDLGSPAGCIGKTLPSPAWGTNLSEASLEDADGVLRINPCIATRSPAVWITSTGENKVARLDERDGTEVFRVDTWGRFPQRTSVAADGSVWITNRDSGSYVHLSPDGKPLCSSQYRICQTRAAAVDAKGFAWIGCHDSRELIKVHPTETEGSVEIENGRGAKKTVPVCKEVGRVKLEQTQPYGLAADRNGGLWVGVLGGPTVKVDTTGMRVAGVFKPNEDPVLKQEGGCWSPYGIATDHDGNPWFANLRCNNVVKLDGRSGKVLGVFKGGPEGLKGPRALGTDQAGNVWVSENDSHFVDEFREDGSWVRRVDVAQCGDRGGPLGVAADSEGDMWVALQKENRVMQFRTDGTVLGCHPDGKKTPLFDNPYTYSDFTGASLVSASGTGKTRVRFEHPTRVSWRLLSFRSVTPVGTSFCLRAHATDSVASIDALPWAASECPKGVAFEPRKMALGAGKGLAGRVLEVELDLSSSDPALTPMISDLTAAALPVSR